MYELISFPAFLYCTPRLRIAIAIAIAIAQCIPSGKGYSLAVTDPNQDADLSFSDLFEIETPSYACLDGTFDEDDGKEPGCKQCEKGKYSLNTTFCTDCEAGKTTEDRGAANSTFCDVDEVSPQEKFMLFDATYFYHSNAGGLNLEDHYSKTPEECAQLCQNDAGCKAFDSGKPGDFQAGDCFLSYDTDVTIKKGDIRTVRQLHVSVKLEAQAIQPVYFRKQKGCQIEGSNDGGLWEDEHSPEACAQLCLHDLSCKSFDAGMNEILTDDNGQKKYGSKIDDCHISYKNAADDDVEMLCDDKEEMDYYERITPVQLAFKDVSWDDNFGDDRDSDQRKAEGSPVDANSDGYFKPEAHDNTVAQINWDHSKSVLERQSKGYDAGFGWIGNREAFAEIVRTAVAKVMGDAAASPGVLLQRADDDDYVVATVNYASDYSSNTDYGDADDKMAAAIEEGDISVSFDDTDATATTYDPKSCANGYVSVSGMTPSCQACPMDTFANRAKLWCRACPIGMQSKPRQGADQQTKACLPVNDISEANKGAFRYGYEWVGNYAALLGSDGDGRVGTGWAKLTVTESDLVNATDPSEGVSITVLAEIWHGEFCVRTNRICRSAGESSFYLRGIAQDDKIDLYKNCAGNNVNTGKTCYDANNAENPLGDSVAWIGITDRNTKLFNPFDIHGKVKHVDGNTVVSSTATPPDADTEGAMTLIQRCHSNEKAGTFDEGDEFFGTYGCYRDNDDKDVDERQVVRIADVRRMKVEVTDTVDCDALSDDDDTDVECVAGTVDVIAKVNFDYGGDSQDKDLLPVTYTVEGKYNKARGSFLFDPVKQGAWKNGKWPAGVPARQISGKLSDDGEFISGAYNDNPNCACTGKKYDNVGGQCAVAEGGPDGSENLPWCFVDSACSESTKDDDSGFFWAPCANDYKYHQHCSAVKLARVCSTSAPLCEAGWTRNTIQNRCYKYFGNGKNQTAAQTACEEEDGNLVSIHTTGENRFVSTLLQDVDAAAAWIGLSGKARSGASSRDWTDETPTTYTSRLGDAGDVCVKTSDGGKWTSESCDEELPYICRKVPIGRSLSCDCSGESDENHFGGSCKKWDRKQDPDAKAWCHASPDCPRAVKILPANGFYKATCDDGEATTTAAVTTKPEKDLKCHENDDTTFQMNDDDGNPMCMDCTTARDCDNEGTTLFGKCDKFQSPTCETCPDGKWRKSSTKCLPCDARCGTCVGPRASQCWDCIDPLFFFARGKDDDGNPTGTCESECHKTRGKSIFKDKDTQLCTDCTECTRKEFQESACTEYNNTVCSTTTSVCSGDQFEAAAPTETSDRICQDVTPEDDCECGVDESATAFSNTVCTECTTTTPTTTTSTPTTTATSTATTTPLLVATTTVACVVCEDYEFLTTECDQSKNIPGYCDRCRECFSSQWQAEPCGEDTNTVCLDPTECGEGRGDGFDTYTAVEFTSTSDRKCEITTQCIPGEEYAEVEGTDDTNRVCKKIEPCPEGEFVIQGTDESKDPPKPICSPCKNGQFSNAQTQAACPKSSACPQACVDQETCEFGTKAFYKSGSADTSDRECVDCEKGEFGKGGESTVCEKCSQGTYSDRDILKTGECKKWTACPHGQEEKTKPTDTSDRICKECDLGESHSSDGDPCKDVTACNEGEYEAVPATLSSDRKCAACGSGRYRSDDMPAGQCAKWSDECGKGVQEITGPTVTNDRECRACPEGTYFDRTRSRFEATSPCKQQPDCVAGEYAVKGTATASSKKICRDCPYGQFSSEKNQDECTAHTVCEAGTYEKEEPSFSSDRVCDDCDPDGRPGQTDAGYTSDSNYAECEDLTDCERGEGEIRAATPTQDRLCGPCDPNSPSGGTFQDTWGQTECQDATICGTGEEEIRAPTLTTDRKCGACAANTYKTSSDDECIPQPTGTADSGKGIDTLGDARTQRTFANCPKKQFQPYQTGACQPCIDGVNFLADPGDDKCTLVQLVEFVVVEFTYSAPNQDDLDWATNNFPKFTQAIQDKLFQAVGGKKDGIRSIKKKVGRRGRKSVGVALTAEMDINAHKDLTEAAYAVKGGLDFNYKATSTTAAIKMTFKLGSKTQAPFAITGAADLQPNTCTEIVAATKISDRQCEETSVEVTSTPTPTTTEIPQEAQGSSDRTTTTDPDAKTTIDPVQQYLDDQANTIASIGGGGGSSSLVIIIAVVVVVVIIIAVVAFLMVRKNGGNSNFQTAQSFENPMYDQGFQGGGQGGQPQQGQQATGGYMDVGAGAAAGESFDDPTYSLAGGQAGYMGDGNAAYDNVAAAQGTGGYMDVQVNNGGAASGGYMDVQGNSGGGATGYMDVQPNQDDDSDEEV